MRIGVNAVPLNIMMGGLRQYFHRLFRELLTTDRDNSYVFFYSAANEDELGHLGTDRWREGAVRVEGEGEILLHLMKIDVYFCPFNMLWPRPLPVASVVQLADIQEVFYPQFFTEEILQHRRDHYAASTRGADAVITLSEFSRETIAKHHLIDPSNIFVAPLSADGFFHCTDDPPSAADLNLPERFILYPANQWHHKNHDGLLKALALLKNETGTVIPCVCTGFPMHDGYPLQEKISEYGLEGQVLSTGYISAEEMSEAYSRATMLCFPSLFEGFGMPVLEAMVAGCPVACASTASLPEIAGDAAVMFDPVDHRQIADALMRLWSDPSLREELVERGKERAKAFTASRTATAHLKAFEHAYGSFLPDSRSVYDHFIYEKLDRCASSEIAQTDNRLHAMEASLSWKITAPIRWLGDKCRFHGGSKR